MKVALCLSGHLRSYDKAFQSLRASILEVCNPDVFIFTYDKIGFDKSDRGDSHLINKNTDQNHLNQLYHFKKILIEKIKVFDTKKYLSRLGSGVRNPSTIPGMYNGIKKANDLKSEYEQEHNFKYDLVIRARFDSYFTNQLDQNEFGQINSGILFPNFGSYSGLNDQFFFGNSDNMNTICNTYNHLDSFFDQGMLFHAETALKYSVNYFKIPILRTNIQFDLLRANGYRFKLARETHLGDIK